MRSRLKIITRFVVTLIPLLAMALHPSSSRTGEKAMAFAISSTSFTNGGDIPKKFTCDGADVSPQLSWSEPPVGTNTFALLVDDPDAPVGNWNHWTLWNLPAETRHLA